MEAFFLNPALASGTGLAALVLAVVAIIRSAVTARVKADMADAVGDLDTATEQLETAGTRMDEATERLDDAADALDEARPEPDAPPTGGLVNVPHAYALWTDGGVRRYLEVSGWADGGGLSADITINGASAAIVLEWQEFDVLCELAARVRALDGSGWAAPAPPVGDDDDKRAVWAAVADAVSPAPVNDTDTGNQTGDPATTG